MTQVVIQPSYGNRDARRHWGDTLEQEVAYGESGFVEALTDQERAALEELHPSGKARFWGATCTHDARMATLTTGDIVLLTGQNHVRAVGEVGCTFRNPAFADRLWTPDDDAGSYVNVYSLLAWQRTAIPYQEIWDLPGFTRGDNFQRLRFLDDDRGATIIDGLSIEPQTAAVREAHHEQQLSATLSNGQVVAAEAVNTASTSYQTYAGTTLVHRAEALLVAAYRETLQHAEVGRIRTASGITDLYVRNGPGTEIVEAKRSADHSYVRQALGQLLDYVLHAPEPVALLSGLFPKQPSADDVALLHRYGVDCLYREADGSFVRLPAPASRRQYMAQVWTTAE